MPSVLLSWLKIEAEEIEEGRGIERIGVDREDGGGEETTNLTPSKVSRELPGDLGCEVKQMCGKMLKAKKETHFMQLQ